MVKVFDKSNSQTTVDIVEDTLDVDANGDVTFRTSRGKGSGRPVKIPGDQFETFIGLLTETVSRRKSLAEKATAESNDNSVDENTTSNDSE